MPSISASPPLPRGAGALLSAGDRLTPDTISKVGAALASVTQGAGDDEEVWAAAARATGAYCKHCSAEELRAALVAAPGGPLAPPSSRVAERIGAAQAAAAIGQHAAARLEEQALLQRFVGERLEHAWIEGRLVCVLEG